MTNLEQLFEQLQINTPDPVFHEVFDAACEEYRTNGVFFLENRYIDHVNSFCNCLSNCINDVQAAAALVKNDANLALYALFVYRCMERRADFMAHLKEFVFPKGDSAAHAFLPFLILLPSIPALYDNLQARKIPEDVIHASLRQYEDCVFLYEQRFHRLGLHKGYFDHLQGYVDAKILNIGRLRYETESHFHDPVAAFQNAAGEIAILFDGAQINSRGMLAGTPPLIENEPVFTADVTETPDAYEGYLADASGRCQPTKTRLDKKTWRILLRRGDPVLSVHIIAGLPFDPALCEDSYRRAKEIYKTYYPEFAYKCFYCHSWLLDPQLENFLRPESNIVHFGKTFTRFAGKAKGTDVFNFVFRLQFKEYKDMPEDTSLQRALKKHYLAGNYIYETSGIFCY